MNFLGKLQLVYQGDDFVLVTKRAVRIIKSWQFSDATPAQYSRLNIFRQWQRAAYAAGLIMRQHRVTVRADFQPLTGSLPHSLLVDETHTVYVCDRENHRVQVFTPNGEFKEMWTDIQRPMDISEFAEGDFLISEGAVEGKPSRCSVVDKHGKVLSRWESRSAHGSWVDSRGDVYLGLTGDKSVDKCVRQP